MTTTTTTTRAGLPSSLSAAAVILSALLLSVVVHGIGDPSDTGGGPLRGVAASSSSASSASSSASSVPSVVGPSLRRLHRAVRQEWARRDERRAHSSRTDGDAFPGQQRWNETSYGDVGGGGTYLPRNLLLLDNDGLPTPPQPLLLVVDIHRHLDVEFATFIHSAAMEVSQSVRRSRGHYYYHGASAGAGDATSATTAATTAAAATAATRDNNNNNRRHFLPATTYGADPTGRMDSTAAFDALMGDVLSCHGGFPCHKMASNIVDLGGATIDLEGGVYLMSRPIYVPPMYGNLNIMNGSLRAATSAAAAGNAFTTATPFPSDRWLIEIGNVDECHPPDGDGQGSCNEFVNLHHLLLDGQETAAGGVKIDGAMGTTIDTVFVVGFPYVGIQVNGGHETQISNSWLAEWYWDRHSPGCGSRKSVGIQLNGNDNYVTNTVVFHCTKVGVQVNGGANLLTGVHTWNGGGVGIQLGGPIHPARTVRLIDCYLDYSSLDVYSPRAVTVEFGFFLQTGVNLFPSTPPEDIIDGLVLRGSSYIGGERRPEPIEVVGRFSKVRHVQVGDDLCANGRATRVTRSLSLTNSTSWVLDFTDALLFPGMVDRVSYSVVSSGDRFFSHMARPPLFGWINDGDDGDGPPTPMMSTRVEIVTSEPADATMHVTVEQAI